MTLEIRASVPVYTADDEWVGDAFRLYKRLKDVNPQLKLYAYYLKVVNLRIGEDFFIPTDFIERYDAQTQRLVLRLTAKKMMQETVSRMPDFVAHGEAEVVPLPAEIEAADAPLKV